MACLLRFGPSHRAGAIHTPAGTRIRLPTRIVSRPEYEKTTGVPTPVAVKIKLTRLGKIRAPQYRIVVADARTRRDGRAIETIGRYHPKEEPSYIEVDSERAQYWLRLALSPPSPSSAS